MNPSHSSVHVSIDAYSYSYSSPVDNGSPITPTSYLERASGFSQDASSPVEGWSGEYSVGLAEWSEADRAFFEALVNIDVTNTNLSSGSRASIPTQSPPSYSLEPGFLPGLTEAAKPHHLPLDVLQSYTHPSAPSQSTTSPPFEQAVRETTSPLDTLGLMHPPLYNPCVPEGYFATAVPQPSPSSHHAIHRKPSSFPYPCPSLGLSPHTPSIVIVRQRQTKTTQASHHLTSVVFEHPLPEPTVPHISPDLILYPSAHCGSDLDGDHRTDVSPISSRASSRVSSSAPYPSPSPSPPLRTSSTIFASQRRNAPAPTAAPVASNTWQCPYCPYVQSNRRSPDLKRHVKTHTRGADVADWVCCGVPVMDAIELGVPATTLRDAQVFEFDGTLMIGGCRKAFSRRDALKRHLQREKGKCFGDASSLYQPGNRESC